MVEGLASQAISESCALTRKGGGEALTGVHVGEVLSCEIVTQLRDADALLDAEGHIDEGAIGEPRSSPARSETLCMRARSAHGNWEILRSARGVIPRARAVNPQGTRRR